MDLIVYGATCPEGEERALAWHLLRLAIQQEFGIEELPKVLREERGKPYFPDVPALFFNISHSRSAAVCALHNTPVGIDVEKVRPAPRRLAAGMEDEAFFRLWTAKEATIKREGQNLAALLRPLDPDKRCQCLEGFLPGYLVTVCPTVPGPIRMVRADG